MFRESPYAGRRAQGFARDLRRASTPWEQRLWALLCGRRLSTFKFRRQVPLGSYIADFVCYEARLVIELDGSQHAEDHAYDARRDNELERRGFRVLRIGNHDLTTNRDQVLDTIAHALEEQIGAD